MNRFDRSLLNVRERDRQDSLVHLADAPRELPGVPALPPAHIDALSAVARWLRDRKGPKVWFLGGHVFKANVGWYLRHLIRNGWVDHLACTGAGLVHDWELSSRGHTSERVPQAIRDGSFGMWRSVAELNEIVRVAYLDLDKGCARAVGSKCVSSTPNRGVLGEAVVCRKAVTAHVSVGQDIFFQHANCDGEAWGGASYLDFLELAETVRGMQDGTFLCFGSAVAGPEVFLKALAMARNANGNGKPDDLAVAVFDRVAPPDDPQDRYFNRPHKTLLGRVGAAQAAFVCLKHEVSVPNLWRLLHEP